MDLEVRIFRSWEWFLVLFAGFKDGRGHVGSLYTLKVDPQLKTNKKMETSVLESQ